MRIHWHVWRGTPLFALAACAPAVRQAAEAPPDIHLATFSIVARDPRTGDLGVAVATCLPAVGMIVPHAEADVGAVANQALVNPAWGTEAMRRLRAGEAPADILPGLQGSDPGHGQRQIAIVDNQGRVAAFTGAENRPWAGHVTGEGFSVQGNILTGRETLDAMADAYRRMPGELPDRLLAALEAGDLAGGDARGKESAALFVVRKGAFFHDTLVDLRVDEHHEPVGQLRTVYESFALALLRRRDVVRPGMETRGAWGAAPAKGRGAYGFPQRVTIHHRPAKADAEGLRALQRAAQDEEKWIDVPFHYAIDAKGTVYEGRPMMIAGEPEGEYDPEGHVRIDFLTDAGDGPVPKAQGDAAAMRVAWLNRYYGIPADAVKTHAEAAGGAPCPSGRFHAFFSGEDFARRVQRFREKR